MVTEKTLLNSTSLSLVQDLLTVALHIIQGNTNNVEITDEDKLIADAALDLPVFSQDKCNSFLPEFAAGDSTETKNK